MLLKIKEEAEVCQLPQRPHSGPMIHQNNSQNSGKLLFLWLCFITVEYRLKFAKGKDEVQEKPYTCSLVSSPSEIIYIILHSPYHEGGEHG